MNNGLSRAVQEEGFEEHFQDFTFFDPTAPERLVEPFLPSTLDVYASDIVQQHLVKLPLRRRTRTQQARYKLFYEGLGVGPWGLLGVIGISTDKRFASVIAERGIDHERDDQAYEALRIAIPRLCTFNNSFWLPKGVVEARQYHLPTSKEFSVTTSYSGGKDYPRVYAEQLARVFPLYNLVRDPFKELVFTHGNK